MVLSIQRTEVGFHVVRLRDGFILAAYENELDAYRYAFGYLNMLVQG